MDTLKGLFGGGETEDINNASAGNLPPMRVPTPDDDPNDDIDAARDFISRVNTGKPDEGFSNEEATARLQQAAKRASPEQMQAAVKEAVGKMDEGQRADFAKMLQERQAGVQRPAADGGGGGGEAAGLDDILGGLLGGSSGGSGGGLDDILGGLLGGSSANTGATSGGGGGSGGGLGDMLGDLLGSPAGKAAVGSIAAILMGQVIGDKKG